MKKLNAKGFTLIELLAVITIMGILMLVAIPTISRTIENSRRDMFLDTAKQYVNGVKNMWSSDSLECPETTGNNPTYYPSSSLKVGTYYVLIDTSKTSSNGPGTSYPIILESGGKSSWSGRNLKGYVKVVVGNNGNTFYTKLSDNTHGISDDSINYLNLKRGNVVISGVTYPTTPTSALVCKEV